MSNNIYIRIVKTTIAISIFACLVALLLLAADLRAYEFIPLIKLAGISSLITALAWVTGAAVFAINLLQSTRNRYYKPSKWSGFLIAAWLALTFWIGDWLFLETPISYRIQKGLLETVQSSNTNRSHNDFQDFSLTKKTPSHEKSILLQNMYDRIVINNPEAYSKYPLGATIDKYSMKYNVDPITLFFFAYVNSFWGEATSGPIPFTHSMTSETFRDVIQAHLPSWFIESKARQWLISSNFLEIVTGKELGFKLRYALHKATLDISTQPYDLNLFSDVLLVLKEYPDEFPELTIKDPSPIITAFQRSYHEIKDSALISPYEIPYNLSTYDEGYYKTHRNELKNFARSSFYLTATDFDFATRLMALNIKYQIDYYLKTLGSERWNSLPSSEQISLLGMTRDLYAPNVGHLSYNLYSLPELNCVPVEFVASSFLQEAPTLDSIRNKTWRPQNYQMLWGGAATKLRILSELWMVVTNHPLPELEPENTLAATRRVIN